jgi:hypothetical protein
LHCTTQAVYELALPTADTVISTEAKRQYAIQDAKYQADKVEAKSSANIQITQEVAMIEATQNASIDHLSPSTDNINGDLRRGTGKFGYDEPGRYVSNVREVVANPPTGTSNNAAHELSIKYARTLDDLAGRDPGTTIFGTESADIFKDNSFDITKFPEEFLNDSSNPTYHKYGVITYFGKVDESLGITKEFLIKNVLESRYSFPGKGVTPVKANFTGESQVYAVNPGYAMWDSDSLSDPANYTYPIGIIQQAKVPDGVLNITTERHDVYPGTIRRTVIEKDGNLFLFTSGAGENNFRNLGGDMNKPLSRLNPLAPIRDIAQLTAAHGNDKYGPMAFKALDQQAFKYVQSIRNGQKGN